MSNTVYLPQRINVGYQKRNDTYTGKLAYVVYYDQKGKLRKEASWNSWRDNKLNATEYENVPTEGFVLNKKVGGYSNGWDHRQTYSRVYDPRGFEFEITVPNLLYILENTNSIKGKGLEGKFVYGWDGTDLLLIPEEAPEFTQYQEFSSLLTNKETIKSKDLILGATYLTNKNAEVIYMGRFDKWDIDHGPYDYTARKYHKTDVNKGKHHFFYSGRNNKKKAPEYIIVKSLSGRILKSVTTVPVSNYADLMDELESQTCYSPHVYERDAFLHVTKEVVLARSEPYYGLRVYLSLDGISLNANLRTIKEVPVTEDGPYEEDMDEADDTEHFSGDGKLHTIEGKYILSGIDRRGGSDHWRDKPVQTVIEKLIDLGHAERSYYNTGQGVPLKTLLDAYTLTYKQEYLANGKAKR